MPLEELIKQLIEINLQKYQDAKLTIQLGTVKAVREFYIDVDDFDNVRLVSVDESIDYMIQYPKIGSIVAFGRIENTDTCLVLQCSEIEKVIVKVGLLKFEMIDNKFKIESGSANLKSILNQVLQQLQNLVITTPQGPGSLSPADIAIFNQANALVNQLMI